jgi:hypothetical protein
LTYSYTEIARSRRASKLRPCYYPLGLVLFLRAAGFHGFCTTLPHSQVGYRHQSAQNCSLGWRKQPLRVSSLVLVRREIVHVLRALVSQARLMLSLARRGEAVGRPANRATRESKGPTSSGEPHKHRGRRHRLLALLLVS